MNQKVSIAIYASPVWVKVACTSSMKNQKSIYEQAEAVRGTRHSTAEECNLIQTLNCHTHGSEIARAESLQSFECRIVSVLKVSQGRLRTDFV